MWDVLCDGGCECLMYLLYNEGIEENESRQIWPHHHFSVCVQDLEGKLQARHFDHVRRRAISCAVPPKLLHVHLHYSEAKFIEDRE